MSKQQLVVHAGAPQEVLTATKASEVLGLGIRELQKLAATKYVDGDGNERRRLVKFAGDRRKVAKGESRVFYTAESVQAELEYRQARSNGGSALLPVAPSAIAHPAAASASPSMTKVNEAQARLLTRLPAILERFMPPAPIPQPWEWLTVEEIERHAHLPKSIVVDLIQTGDLYAIGGKGGQPYRVQFRDVMDLRLAKMRGSRENTGT